MELVALHDAGDTVVSLMWQTGRPKGSSHMARQPVAGVYGDFRPGGLIGKTWFFTIWPEALEFAGLDA